MGYDVLLKVFQETSCSASSHGDFGSGVWVSGVRRTRSNAVGLHISGWLGNSHFLPVIIITPPLTSGFRRERQHRDIPLRWSFMVSLFRVCRQHLICFSSSQVFGKEPEGMGGGKRYALPCNRHLGTIRNPRIRLVVGRDKHFGRIPQDVVRLQPRSSPDTYF